MMVLLQPRASMSRQQLASTLAVRTNIHPGSVSSLRQRRLRGSYFLRLLLSWFCPTCVCQKKPQSVRPLRSEVPQEFILPSALVNSRGGRARNLILLHRGPSTCWCRAVAVGQRKPTSASLALSAIT